MKVIIVDDEPQSHDSLRALLESRHPDVEISGQAYGVKQGLQMVKALKPDLLFLDVQMPDGSGFDLLRQIPTPTFHVVFITGYDQFARTAIKFGALDYLLKPIAAQELDAALDRARSKLEEQTARQQLEVLYETLQRLEAQRLPTRLAIHTLDGILFREVETIIRLHAQQNYTEFHFSEGSPTRLLASINLGEYEEQFQPYPSFMRVHRSHLVNLKFVDQFLKTEGGALLMSDGSRVPVSRRYRDELLQRLQNL